MGSWALFSVSSHFFHSSHLQGVGGYKMTGACFTWLHSDSSLCFSCEFWQGFLQSLLKEVLEDTVGKQPPSWCWLCPHKDHKEYNLKSCCGFLASPRAKPRTDLGVPDLSHTWGMSSGLELFCLHWLLPDSCGPEHSSGWINLPSVYVLGLSLQHWFC